MYYVFWFMTSLRKAPYYCLPYEVQANLTLKSALLLLIILSTRKQYTKDYWLFYSQYREGEWQILFLLQLFWNQPSKTTFSAIIYWTMMITVYLICMCLTCNLSFFPHNFWIGDFFHFCHKYFEAVKELHKVTFSISIYTTIKKQEYSNLAA